MINHSIKDRRINIANRKRTNEKKLFLSDDELKVLYEKMALANTSNFSLYARKMLLDGLIIHVDYTQIKDLNRQLSAIGKNINQIAKRANSQNLYKEDINEIKKMLNEIWHIQRQFLFTQL